MKKIVKIILSKFNLQLVRKAKSDFPAVDETKTEILSNLSDIELERKKLMDDHIPFLTFDDFTIDEIEIIKSVLPFTMTGPLRIVSLIRAVKYIIHHKIPGDFIECGVWKGGSMMVIAETLLQMGIKNRNLYLYDTFEGMSNPTDVDISFKNEKAEILLNKDIDFRENGNNIWCYSTVDEVKNNLHSTGYDPSRIHFIEGKVEDTIPGTLPTAIALLRLDTDWYDSTIHELNYLYPLLSKKGILLIDDYGQWMGQKKAVDEYLVKHKIGIFLNRVDFSSRLAINL